MPRSLSIQAHAKINLALAVDRPIPAGAHAGLHPICSWMAPIGLADSVTIVRTHGDSRFSIRWANRGPIEWPIQSDLAFRAHALLEREAGPLPAEIMIEKQIPAGGGLGGGSADAAAVLSGCNTLFGLGLSQDRLCALAGELGSDIPFFITGDADPLGLPCPAAVGGVGDQIERLKLCGPIPLLLIFPPFGCPTGEVYRAFDEMPGTSFRDDDVRRMARDGLVGPAELFNDLASPAIAVRPELGVIRADLERELGLPIQVSGSGSTLFCVGSDMDRAAERAREFLPPKARVILSSVLSS